MRSFEPAARAGCVVFETQKLSNTAPGGSASEQLNFGSCLGISNNVAVAGQASFFDGTAQGCAHVLTLAAGSWSETQLLTASDTGGNDQFGLAAAIDGDVIVVGAPQDDAPGLTDVGSAYVFRHDGAAWVEEAHLLASDGAANDHFGSSVSVRGDVIVIGSPDDDDAGSGSGSVYVFRHNGSQWAQEQKLTASPGAAAERFGFSVSTDGTAAAVGTGVKDTGNAYVFRFDGAAWNQEAHFTGPAGQPTSTLPFRTAVAIDQDRLAVGAPQVDVQGAVFTYRYASGSWGPPQKLFDPDLSGASSRFGASVAISGGRLAVGAPTASYTTYPNGIGPSVSFAGAVSIYRDGGAGWIPYTTLHAVYVENAPGMSNPNAMDRLGWSVALDGTDLFAGAPRDNQFLPPVGSAFYLDTDLPDCDGDGNADACDPDCDNDLVSDVCEIASGDAPDCDADGQPDACEIDFQYQKDNGLPLGTYGPSPSGQAGDVLWLNSFQVKPGGSFVTHVAVAWNGYAGDGTPVTLLLYKDPTNDGDPHDAVLLATGDAATTAKFGFGPLNFSTYAVPRTYVGAPGDVFFVGAKASCPAGTYIAMTDQALSVGLPNWIAFNSYQNADLEHVAANNELQTIPRNFVVRALSLDCNGNGIPDFCDISSGTSADADADGVPDECENPCRADIAPTGGNGVVDVDDLFAVINAWGECPKGRACLADIMPVGAPDGVVDVDDLFAVINGWGKCP